MWQLKNPFKERMEGGNTGVVMGFLPEDARNHLVAWLAEFAGTFLFLFFSFSIATVANTPPAPADSHPLPDVSKLLYIALGFGCSVAINVWIFYRISGGQLNPAVCLQMRWIYPVLLTLTAGDLDSVAGWSSSSYSMFGYCHSADSRWYSRSWNLVCSPARPISCQCAPRWWHLSGPRPFH